MNLEQDIIEKLEDPLDPSLVATRWDGAKYLEGYVVIEQANRIFGLGNWGYRVIEENENSVGCKATVEFWLFGELVSRDRGFVDFPFASGKFGEMTGAIYDTAYKGCCDGRHEAGVCVSWTRSSGTRSTRSTARLRSRLHPNRLTALAFRADAAAAAAGRLIRRQA